MLDHRHVGPVVTEATAQDAAPCGLQDCGLGGRVVDRAGNGVREAVVFVQTTPPGVTPPANPRPAVMDQINKTFVPHILPVVIGTDVWFPNHDQIHQQDAQHGHARTDQVGVRVLRRVVLVAGALIAGSALASAQSAPVPPVAAPMTMCSP